VSPSATPSSGPPPAEKPLDEYHAKRDFALTPEPAGAAHADGAAGRRFVVQRHRARRVHYDFRLEVDGVLASWAVPKGPTLDPTVRSLAVHVEDHPLEYRDFEGVIPTGQYGGGDVIVWDRGTWDPSETDDPGAAIAKGEIHFDLFGEKLRGRFVLVRTRRDRSGKEQWLLLHKHDEFAVDGWNPDDHPESVKSGRTNDEVAAAPDAQWHSDRPAAEAEVAVADQRRKAPGPRPERRTWDPPTDDELDRLDTLGGEGNWAVQGQELKLTNLDKALFPGRDGEEPITKRDLVRYYTSMAPVMLPYLVDRPVNLNRFPNGSDKPGFWHKEVPNFAPEWISRWDNTEAAPGESQAYFVLDSVPALAWMANYAAVELHAWTSRIPRLWEPTWAYIDIDPGTKTSFEEVVLLARLFRSGLEHLGVDALPKLTGQRGIHIWIPIVGGYSFEDTRVWTEKLSRAVGATVPELVSWEWQKSRRRGLARLDYTQNARNKTLVAPFSTRPAPGAPVSVTLEWDELDDPDLRSDGWTVRTAPGRVAAQGDPYARLLDHPQKLPAL
jgi:bifunctional non-homologous end joining protein LigD